jgi:hypothetical protein
MIVEELLQDFCILKKSTRSQLGGGGKYDRKISSDKPLVLKGHFLTQSGTE